MNEKIPPIRNIVFKNGKGVSPGRGLGTVKTLDSVEPVLNAKPDEGSLSNSETYTARINKIIESVRITIKDEMAQCESEESTAFVTLSTQQMMLNGAKRRLLEEKQAKPNKSIQQIAIEFYTPLSKVRESEAAALLWLQILAENAEITTDDISHIHSGDIVVASNIGVSLASKIMRQRPSGVITQDPKDSHLASIALEHGIPCVTEIDLGSHIHKMPPGTLAAVNGKTGTITVAPNPDNIERYERKIKEQKANREAQIARAIKDCVTADGQDVPLYENKTNLDLESSNTKPFDAIGLIRLETALSEMQGMIEATRLTHLFNKHPDTILHGYQREAAKGRGELKGMDFMLANPSLYKEQLRALIRTHAEHPIRIMVPYVTSAQQMAEIRKIFDGVYEEVKSKPGAPILLAPPQLILMAETQSLTHSREEFAESLKLADGVSIGGNDLLHEIYGTNRYASNPQAPNSYGLEFLERIAMIADVAAEQGKEASFCGNKASDLDYLPVLLALKITPVVLTDRVYDIRDRISELKMSDCERIVDWILKTRSNDNEKNRALIQNIANNDRNDLSMDHDGGN